VRTSASARGATSADGAESRSGGDDPASGPAPGVFEAPHRSVGGQKAVRDAQLRFDLPAEDGRRAQGPEQDQRVRTAMKTEEFCVQRQPDPVMGEARAPRRRFAPAICTVTRNQAR